MKIHRPRTFLNLVILGFFIVSLPLCVGLFSTISFLEHLSEKSINIIEHSVAGARDSAKLSEYLVNQERNLRLFKVTGESEYLFKSAEWNIQIYTILESLSTLPVGAETKELIAQMQSVEDLLLSSLAISKNHLKSDSNELSETLEAVTKLRDNAEKVGLDMKKLMDQEVQNMKTFSKEARTTLFLQTFGFLLATIFMIYLFAMIISSPVKQLNTSVKRLGNGDFTTPVLVSGPKDLGLVGEKLDWLRQRLAELERQKAKFIAHVSHELKTPLASIREGAGLLSEELAGPLNKQQKEVSEILVSNSVKLQNLIENLLNYNMAQAGKTMHYNTQVNLRPIIERVAREQKDKVLSKNIQLELDLHDVTVPGNRKELEMIFANLFSNCANYAPEKGVVGCKLDKKDGKVVCEVYDNGPGIQPTESVKIFDPFYQVDDGSRHRIRGSGIGLAIVKEYVSHHGGDVRVLQRGEQGAHFEVVLPRLT